MLVLQYCDMARTKIEVLAYTDVMHQNNVRVYPKVDMNAKYKVNGAYELTGAEIDENGIDLPIGSKYTMRKIILEKI